MSLQKEFNFHSLMVKDEDGRYRHASSEEIIEAALSEVNKRFSRGKAITSPEATKEFLQLKLAHLEHEIFAVLWLDLCAALRNVELGRPHRLLTRIWRRQLHISTITVDASS